MEGAPSRLGACVVVLVACGSTTTVSRGEKVGAVTFLELTSGGMDQTLTAAGFSIFVQDQETSSEGPCLVSAATFGTRIGESAGLITISYGTNQSFTMEPGGAPEYSNTASTFLYPPDGVISVSAAGSVVPAFSTNITFPASTTVTSPTALSGVSKSGFSATWAATTSDVHILFNQYPDNAHATSIDCSYAGSAGSGDVPAAALTDLSTTMETDVSIHTATLGSAQAGDYAVGLEAIVVGYSTTVPVGP